MDVKILQIVLLHLHLKVLHVQYSLAARTGSRRVLYKGALVSKDVNDTST